MAGGARWKLSADSSEAVRGTKEAADGFADLETQQQQSIETGDKLAEANEGVNKTLEAAKTAADLGTKAWDLYAGTQKKMAAAVIELARGFGKASPTAKGFVETTDRLEERFGPLEKGITDANEALQETAEVAPEAAEGIIEASEGAKDGRITFIAFASAIQLTEIAFRAARSVYAAGIEQLTKLGARADIGDDLAKTAKAYNAATDALQGYRSAAGLAGVDASTVDRAFIGIQRSAVDAARGLSTAVDMFDMAHVSATRLDGSIKSADEIMQEISVNMAAGLIPTTQQAAIAAALFRDRSGRLTSLLREGPGVVQENIDRLRSYGALMSEELLVASEEFGDSSQRLRESQEGLRNVLALGTLPALAALQNTLANAATEGGGLRDRLAEILDRGSLLARGIVLIAESIAQIPPMVARAVATSTEAVFGFFESIIAGARATTGALGAIALRVGNRKAIIGVARLARSIDGVGESLGDAREEAVGLVSDLGTGAAGITEGLTGFADRFLEEYREVLAKMAEGLPLAGTGEGAGGIGAPGGAEDNLITVKDGTEIVLDKTRDITAEWAGMAGHMGTAVSSLETMFGTEVKFLRVLSGIIQKIQAFIALVQAIRSIGQFFGGLSGVVTPGLADAGRWPLRIADGGFMPGHTITVLRDDETVVDPVGTRPLARMFRWFEQHVTRPSGQLAPAGPGGGGPVRVMFDAPIILRGEEVGRIVLDEIVEATRGGRGGLAGGALEFGR